MTQKSPSKQRFGSCLASSTQGGRAGKRAFTLIELLIVVGAIAVLAGIAIPVYSRVTAGAERAECTSRMRGLGMSILLYEGEQGKLPRSNAAYLEGPGGTGVGAELIDMGYASLDERTWYCASNPLFEAAGISYAINNFPNTEPAYFFGGATGSSTFSPRRISQIRSSGGLEVSTGNDPLSSVWLLADIDGQNFTGGSGSGNLGGVTPAHDARRNYMFFDGHIELRSETNWPHPVLSSGGGKGENGGKEGGESGGAVGGNPRLPIKLPLEPIIR